MGGSHQANTNADNDFSDNLMASLINMIPGLTASRGAEGKED